MGTSGNLLPDSVFERGTSLPGSRSNKAVQRNRANRVKQPVVIPAMAAKMIPLTISCPGRGHREVSIVGMQAPGEEAEKWGSKNLTDWDTVERISIPHAAVIRNTTGECLMASEPAESRRSPSELAMFQSDGERHSLTADFVSPQSPLISKTVSGNEEPPSPGTTLVDDESISSELTSVDSCLPISRSLASAETVELNSFGTEANFHVVQAILHAQTSPESILTKRRHYTVRNRETPFTDSTEFYYKSFAIMLRALNSKNSEKNLCIERYLTQSEALWFSCAQGSRMGKPRASSPSSLAYIQKLQHRNTPRKFQSLDIEKASQSVSEPHHRTMTGLRSILLIQIGDWPVYSLLIALVRMEKAVLMKSFLADNIFKGPDSCSELLPYYPPDGRDWSVRHGILHHVFNIHRNVSILVDLVLYI